MTRKKLVDKDIIQLEIKTDNTKEYKVKFICDSAIYIQELEGHHPSSFYYPLL